MSSIPQPLVAYPQAISAQPSSPSKGSFTPVFIVLAVITVLATVACIVGRLCTPRFCQPKAPSGRGRGRACARGDVEDGFGVNSPAARPAEKSRTKKGEVRPTEDEELNKYPEIRGTKGLKADAAKTYPETKGDRGTNPETKGARGDNHPATNGMVKPSK